MAQVIGSNTVEDGEALRRLMKLQHIVVVMMENRSFDSMLGYLRRDGMPELEGLVGDESNPSPDGSPVSVFEWGQAQTVFHPPEDHTGKILDPCHSPACVHEQLSGGNKGFVKNFVATREKDKQHVTLPEIYQRLPMGYYAAEHLPTYDFLARNYCVCDAWHSSVPGDTWPNRLFSLAGQDGPRDLPGLIRRIEDRLGHHLASLDNAPIYDVRAFTQELGEDQWRWYSHDPATLRAADSAYRHFDQPDRGNFAFFDRQSMSVLTKALEAYVVDPDSFLDDCAAGKLRQVSWVDPNFIDLHVLDPNSNDDHPPSDIRAGQAFILELYEALASSPSWSDTLLVVVYDEHGGFFDHVPPPPVPPGDGSGYETYGLRVPALLVGPRVANGICHDLFDHTSLINTILRRFAPDPDDAIARMPGRVGHARHLGYTLLDEPRSDIPEPDDQRRAIATWREAARTARRGQPGQLQSTAPDGAGHPFWMHDFQEEFVKFALTMRRLGLDPGQP
jgi:phospholipase C